MENKFREHIEEWLEMNQQGRFSEARQYYFEELFNEVIENFVKKDNSSIINDLTFLNPEIVNLEKSSKHIDILFSILGFSPEPIILAAKALRPRKHIIFHGGNVGTNLENMKFLPEFLKEGYEKIELPDESFNTIYEVLKQQMALNAGRNYTINITGGKKSMVSASSIFARDYNASIIYVDYEKYDPNLRRPLPGSEYLELVYNPIRNLPDIYHQYNHQLDLPNIESQINQTESIKQEASKHQLREDFSKDDTKSWSLEELINSKNFKMLSDYLDNNLKDGIETNKIQTELSEILKKIGSVNDYLEISKEFLNYNPHIFLGTLVKRNYSALDISLEIPNKSLLNDVLNKAFSCPDKIKHALNFINPFKEYLTFEQKEFIKDKCKTLPYYDYFKLLFTITKMTLEEQLQYLIKIPNNRTASFIVFEIYSSMKNQIADLHEKDYLNSFKIKEYISKLEDSADYGLGLVAQLINDIILEKGKCPKELKESIEISGHEGFSQYMVKNEKEYHSAVLIKSLKHGDLITNLTYIKPLDNHYLFYHNKSETYGLLDKSLCVINPSKDYKLDAYLNEILNHQGKTIFLLSQKKPPKGYVNPNIINIGSSIEVGFKQNNNKKWKLIDNKYWKLLSISLISMPKTIDYRKKQMVRVLKSDDLFSCECELLNE